MELIQGKNDLLELNGWTSNVFLPIENNEREVRNK